MAEGVRAYTFFSERDGMCLGSASKPFAEGGVCVGAFVVVYRVWQFLHYVPEHAAHDALNEFSHSRELRAKVGQASGLSFQSGFMSADPCSWQKCKTKDVCAVAIYTETTGSMFERSVWFSEESFVCFTACEIE